MTDKADVEQFLRDLKEKIKFFDVAFRPRDKNTDTLTALDILPVKRIEYLLGLTVENYYSGPNKDTYDMGKPDYYEFGIKVKGQAVYIKISLGLANKMVDCMSFHLAEYPITYSFKPKIDEA